MLGTLAPGSAAPAVLDGPEDTYPTRAGSGRTDPGTCPGSDAFPLSPYSVLYCVRGLISMAYRSPLPPASLASWQNTGAGPSAPPMRSPAITFAG